MYNINNKYLRNSTNSYTTATSSKLAPITSNNNTSSSRIIPTLSSTLNETYTHRAAPSTSATTTTTTTNFNKYFPLSAKMNIKPFKPFEVVSGGSSSGTSSESPNRSLLTSTRQPIGNKFASMNSSSSSVGASMSKSENLITSLLHTTSSRNGKVSKRKPAEKMFMSKNKNYQTGLVQAFNLAEKERFAQLIRNQTTGSSLITGDKSDIYKNLIKSSPQKTRDDNTLSELRQRSQRSFSPATTTTTAGDKYSFDSLSNYKDPASLGRRSFGGNNLLLTRKLDLLGSIKPVTSTTVASFETQSNRSRRHGTASRNDESIFEVLSTTVDENETALTSTSTSQFVPKKKAQKRPPQEPIPEIVLEDDDDDDDDNNNNTSQKNKANEVKAQAEAVSKLSNYQCMGKSNRPLTQLEKKLEEKLNISSRFLQSTYKPSTVSNALVLEEARYKQKKIIKLDREKVEKDLAIKFSKQLQLESTRISRNYFREEEEIEEDDFPTLTIEQEELIQSVLVPHPQDQVFVSAFNTQITRRDLHTLHGLNWLNDEVINFYMNLICERSKEADLKRCYAFSTFFYPKLLKEGYSQSLKRWTRRVDLFAHDLVLIPIHLGLHWTLAVIDFSCCEIRYYDSMNGYNNECLKLLKNYIKEEYADKKGGAQLDLAKWNCLHVREVPQQMNGSDCGMFTCKYAEYLSRGRTEFNFNQSHMPYFRRRMIWEIINKKLL